VTPNDTFDPADNRPLFDNAAIAQSDTATIDAHIRRADLVLITHTHYDHALDAPYIASKTGATIIGTESTYHFARGQGVPADKLIVVRGGEDYAFEGLSVAGRRIAGRILTRRCRHRVPAPCQTSVSHG
jgi:L-ascorbate metabolism protein UlaG (beta-lactamase superfamily)